jgi:hypothetical protein
VEPFPLGLLHGREANAEAGGVEVEAREKIPQNRGDDYARSAMSRRPVFDVVAEDWWEYHHNDQPYVAHVSLGRPSQNEDGWYCPLRVAGAHDVWNPFSKHKRWVGWRPIQGAGPLDAVMNALLFAFRMFAEFHPTSVAASVGELEKSARRKLKKKPRARGRARR